VNTMLCNMEAMGFNMTQSMSYIAQRLKGVHTTPFVIGLTLEELERSSVSRSLFTWPTLVASFELN